jgi:hypothetical protein
MSDEMLAKRHVPDNRYPDRNKHQRHERNYRFRRFQALDDALMIYFTLYDSKSWMSVQDLCERLEWNDEDGAVRKRVRRICESLRRVKRVQISHKARYTPMYIRILE